MNYERNKKYFKPLHVDLPLILCIIGLCLFSSEKLISIVLIAVGILLIVVQMKGRPTDEEIDSIVISQLANMKIRALRKLGIDENEISEVDPICFHGYVYDNAMIQKGDDNKYRSSKYQAVIFLFASDEVYCFKYNFSITENIQSESTDVYFYKDIVSVATQTTGTEYSVGRGKKSQFDYEYFRLTTTGGVSVSCTVRNSDDAESSINKMRALIKSKKIIKSPL